MLLLLLLLLLFVVRCGHQYQCSSFIGSSSQQGSHAT